MPPLRSLIAAICLSGMASGAQAQELIGFERSSFGQGVLSNKQSGGVELELSVGSYNNESIRNYSANSIFSKLGRSVGRLDILTDALDTSFALSTKLRLRRSELIKLVPQRAVVAVTDANWETGAIDINMELNAPGTSPDDYFSHALNAAGTLLAAGSE